MLSVAFSAMSFTPGLMWLTTIVHQDSAPQGSPPCSPPPYSLALLGCDFYISSIILDWIMALNKYSLNDWKAEYYCNEIAFVIKISDYIYIYTWSLWFPDSSGQMKNFGYTYPYSIAIHEFSLFFFWIEKSQRNKCLLVHTIQSCFV